MKLHETIAELESKIPGYRESFAKDMRDTLSSKVLQVTYVKSNHEVVTREATNNLDIIKNRTGMEFLKQQANGAGSEPYIISYFDLTVHDWRCFDVNRLCDAKTVEELEDEDL